LKVKIGKKIYDSTKEPVMLILSDSDKSNISNMLQGGSKYCSYPEEGFSVEQIKAFTATKDGDV
jgi:hypothetical protein